MDEREHNAELLATLLLSSACGVKQECGAIDSTGSRLPVRNEPSSAAKARVAAAEVGKEPPDPECCIA
jgi:hypothetical protein